ncbi:MAG TPA: AAA family ATPase [Longimicrobiales bacterium]|nr:AAA family ATPase [Longimicrobiales bacterium]
MARYHAAEPILRAAQAWKERCLLRGGSVFGERPLWTAENFRALDRYFVQNLSESEGRFFPRLKVQLAPAPAAAKQLAAELFWVMYLVVSSSAQSGASKLLQIRQVWEWSGEPLPEGSPYLGEIMDMGVAHPGTAYQTHRWRELLFFITMMQDWCALPPERHDALLKDPWDFAAWIEAREHAKARQLRHVLLFLLFPDQFERILSGSHKAAIIKAFREKGGEASIDYKDRLAVDRRLLMVREHLEEDAAGSEVDFYEAPWRATWRHEGADAGIVDAGSAPIRSGEADEATAWFKGRFGDVGVWALGAGEGGRLWSQFEKDGIAAIGWDALGDLTEYEDKEALRAAISALSGQPNAFNDTLAVWEFSRGMQVGDIVIAKKGRSRLLGWGEIVGEYQFQPERSEYQHVRLVRWHAVEPVEIPRDRWITNKTLTDFGPYKPWVRFAFQLMEGRKPIEGQTPKAEYTIEHALQDLFIPRPAYSETLNAISTRKNVILQGPPGVGKTFVARRIAWTLIGKKDASCLEMVQFHQSYAYEDFVQGWRPTESGGFTLRNGVFYEFCRHAADRPNDPFVFIIDEINRGNLSRVFGELLMLIEPDKRGQDFAIPLVYSRPGERFCVPDNVHILGLMNTADRSLAMVDYALRRRFTFVTIEPAFGSDEFHGHLLAAGVEPDVVRLIDDRLGALNEKIRDDSKNLGPGFEIGHSYFVPTGDEESLDRAWYRGVVRTQIAPLLREYWFDQPAAVGTLVDELLA